MSLKCGLRLTLGGPVMVCLLLLGSCVQCQSIGRRSEKYNGEPITASVQSVNPSTTTQQSKSPLPHLNEINIRQIRRDFPGYFMTPSERKRLELVNGKTFTPVLNVSQVFERCFTDGYCQRTTTPTEKPQTPKFPNFQIWTRLPFFLRRTTTISPNRETTAHRFDQTTPIGSGSLSLYSSGLNRGRRHVSSVPNCSLDEYDQQDLMFHGCCVSHSYLHDPPSLPTAEPGRNGNVEIAQFARLKQYFEMEECCQAKNCSGCQCSQMYYVTSAVVIKRFYRRIRYVSERVRVPGCCKCLNIDREL